MQFVKNHSTMHVDVVAIATRLASALDREDYPAVAALLADDCEYEARTGTMHGPSAIVASYREASESARVRFDEVRYDSAVRADGECSAIVTFVDHLTHRGATCTYSCEQLVRVDTRGRICRISHRELAGQREALDAFLRASTPWP